LHFTELTDAGISYDVGGPGAVGQAGDGVRGVEAAVCLRLEPLAGVFALVPRDGTKINITQYLSASMNQNFFAKNATENSEKANISLFSDRK
jgi:hypothetical protein